MSDEQINFKVTDRRLFNPDGTPRDIPEEEKAQVQPAAPQIVAEQVQPSGETTARAQPTPGDQETEIPDAEDPANFANFIMSIASNAASSLGMMEHPVTHKREVDLELGKHWIDVLGMLQRKTRGNLHPQEHQILESLLADLRMQFVSLSSSSEGKSKSAFTGRDIVGG
jgi:hypothetical protein